MTETSIIASLVTTSPIAAAVIFVVILFLRRQKESEKALLGLYDKNQQIMNHVLEVLGGLKEVIVKCKGPNAPKE